MIDLSERFARMVRELATNLLDSIRSRRDEIDFARLRTNNSQLTPEQRKQVRKITEYLKEIRRHIGLVTRVLEAGDFRDSFASIAINRLYELSTSIDSIPAPEDPIQVLSILNKLKDELILLREEAAVTVSPLDDNTFSILLLTDFHWGASCCHEQWKSIKQWFFNGLKKTCSSGHKLDLVLFTGDLAFSGKWEEYDGCKEDRDHKEFNAFLTELWACLRKSGSDPILLTVPGNHDMVRPSKTFQPELIEILNNYAKINFQNDILLNSNTLKSFEAIFRNYLSWRTHNINCQLKEGGKNELKSGLYYEGSFPGDFSFRLQKGNNSLGIIGLNSAFLQLTVGNMKGRLAVEKEQLWSVCDGNPTKWLQTNSANVLLTHHPVDWLSEHHQQQFHAMICNSESFDIHLHGHLHEHDVYHFGSKGRRALSSIQGRSLLSQEERHDGTTYVNDLHQGYVIIEIKTSPTVNLIRCRPRTITNDGRDIPAIADIAIIEETGWTQWTEARRYDSLTCVRK